jgi:GxxExxY protein
MVAVSSKPVYRAALAIEFARRQIPFEREVHPCVSYDGIPLPCSYRVDFICYESVLVEVKALSAITPRERSQILNYLRASNLHRGLLLNFGTPPLQTQRLVWGDWRTTPCRSARPQARTPSGITPLETPRAPDLVDLNRCSSSPHSNSAIRSCPQADWSTSLTTAGQFRRMNVAALAVAVGLALDCSRRRSGRSSARIRPSPHSDGQH